MPAERNAKHSLVLGLCLMLAACGSPTDTDSAGSTPADPEHAASDQAATAMSPDGSEAAVEQDIQVNALLMAKWARNCALCHVRGEGGAPRLDDLDAWRGRLAQGEDALLTHTIEGLNNMPPLGYCMECERDDLVALIRFMAKRT